MMRRVSAALLVLVVFSAQTLPAADHGGALPGITADEALARLKSGNERYVQGKATHPNADAARRAETAKDGQHPIAIVIGCADSRQPVEILFDQGVGDIFVIRVAGNVAGTDEIGSAEYAVEHLGVSLCIVLGHSKCGAVTAAVAGGEVHGCVGALVKDIKPAVAAAQKEHPELKEQDLIPAAIEANVRQSMAHLTSHSEVLAKLALDGKLRIEGGVYDLETGQIKWLGGNVSSAPAVQPKPATE
jgi:carbonic anhydrase